MTALTQVFTELIGTAPHEDGRAYRSILSASGLSIRVHVDGRSRLPGFSMLARRSAVPEGFSLPRIRGIALSIHPAPQPLSPAHVLYDVSAASEEHAAVFIDLSARLIDEISTIASAESALMHLARKLALWSRFFDDRSAGGLSRARRLGLMGELLCLDQLADGVGIAKALAAWKGPEPGSHQDFQFPGGSIEAKLSTSSAPERISISSERQLDDSVVPNLYLYAAMAQENAGGDVSLGRQVAHLRARVLLEDPVDVALLEDLLLAAGFLDSDLLMAGDPPLVVRESHFHLVTGVFPRLTPRDLMPGVFDVSYDISWAAAKPFRTSFDDLIRRLDV